MSKLSPNKSTKRSLQLTDLIRPGKALIRAFSSIILNDALDHSSFSLIWIFPENLIKYFNPENALEYFSKWNILDACLGVSSLNLNLFLYLVIYWFTIFQFGFLINWHITIQWSDVWWCACLGVSSLNLDLFRIRWRISTETFLSQKHFSIVQLFHFVYWSMFWEVATCYLLSLFLLNEINLMMFFLNLFWQKVNWHGRNIFRLF